MHAELRPPARDLGVALQRLADGPPRIRQTLNRELKSATNPIESAMKANLLGIESRGVRGGGPRQREIAGTTASGRLPRHTGLRQSTARALQTKITYRGFRSGVRIRVDTSKMPEDQRGMPQAMNRGKVRHPIMGRRSGPWVDQTFTPEGWFDRPTRQLGPRAIAQIERAVNEAVRSMQ